MIKILYLEDNKYDVDLTRREIKNAFPGGKIDIASTIERANHLLKIDSGYDVALLDLNLPDGNGIDILVNIREKGLPFPVVILTSSGDEESAIAALKAGADDYLTKKQGYLKKLPGTIIGSIENYKRNLEKKEKQLKVLYVEWNKPDIEFTIRHMHKYAPYIHIDSVLRAEDALEKLPDNPGESCAYDILLLDYRLHGLNALDTIKIIRQELKLSIPIVLVTGHGNEEVAVQALKLGADEYLVKQDNYLFRLPSLLTSAYARYELARQQKELRESETKYRLLAENAGDVIFKLDLDLNYTYVSPAVKELRGFEVEEVLKQNLQQVLTPESFQRVQQMFSEYLPEKGKKHTEKGAPLLAELETYKKNGGTVWIEVKVSVITDENDFPVGIQGVSRDISKRKEVQEHLIKSREEYRNFFEEDLTGDFISTPEGKLLNCNPAFFKIFGFQSKEEALASDLYSLFPSRNDRDEIIQQLREHKKLTSFNLNMLRRDGRLLNIQANLIGGFDGNNELQTIKGYLVDDTERRKATDEIRKLSRAMEQSPVSVIITDLDGNIEYANPKALATTGYSKDELIGQNPRVLNSGEKTKSEYKTLWKTISSGKEWYGEFHNKKKNGEFYWEYASISPIKNSKGQITHYLAVKEDITDKKKREEELIAAKEKAEESDRLKSAFLANMSHEIRTPMNGILGFTNLLLEPDLSSEVKESYIQIVQKSGERMLNTVNDIIEISKIEAGLVQLNTAPVHFNSRVNELYQFFLPEATKKGIQLVLNSLLPHTSATFETDKNKLDSILTNLIKNAIKYTNSGTIELGCKQKHQYVEFYVKDTGIGIPSNRIDAIFNRFEQADIEDTRAFQGSGLGLAIVKSYVKMLGGEIGVESEVGKGSIFWFTLPLKNKPGENQLDNNKISPDGESVRNQIRGLKILIVEDDEPSGNFLSILVNGFSREILKTDNGAKTVELCRDNQDIDLILMDIQLPGMSGYESTLRIREFNKKVIIIAQTAYALSGDKEKAIEAGCNDYISKPVKKVELQKLIEKYFG